MEGQVDLPQLTTLTCRLSEKEASAALLEWHGVLTEKAGMGCIMRALADRRAF